VEEEGEAAAVTVDTLAVVPAADIMQLPVKSKRRLPNNELMNHCSRSLSLCMSPLKPPF